MIDSINKKTVTMAEAIEHTLDFVHQAALGLGFEEQMAHIRHLIEDGTSADRQRGIYSQGLGVKAVSQHLVEMTANF